MVLIASRRLTVMALRRSANISPEESILPNTKGGVGGERRPRVEPGQGCVVVGPEGSERLAHRASLAVAVGARSRESVAVPRAAKGYAHEGDV